MAEIQGTIIRIGETETHGTNFQKREVVIQVTETWQGNNPGSKTYPVPILFIGKSASAPDNFMEGQEVKITYTLRGNEGKGSATGRYFSSPEGYKIEAIGQTAPSNLDRPKQQAQQAQVPADDPDSSLPF